MSNIQGQGISHSVGPNVVRFRSNASETVAEPGVRLDASQDIPDFSQKQPNEAVALMQDSGKKRLLGIGLGIAAYGMMGLPVLAGATGALVTASVVAGCVLGVAAVGCFAWGCLNGIRSNFAKNE